jgi:hypothetical protein
LCKGGAARRRIQIRMRLLTGTLALAVLAMGVVDAQRAAGTRVSTASTCASDLGLGQKSKRKFCDVVITGVPAESVAVTIPPHTGTVTLFFDLHNRFALPVVAGQPLLAYQRHEAIVAVIRPNGVIVTKAASIREFRTQADLFDQIAGGGRPGGVKAIAPGPAEAVRVTIPPGLSSVGIAGLRLTVRTGMVGPETFDTPGRPVAIVSNVRVEYRPAAR